MGKKITAGVGVILVVIFAGGAIYAAHLKIWGLTLNKEVKPIEVATLAFTVIIAILLQFYVIFDADNERAEKDLLILNTRDALSKLRECRDTFVACFEAKAIGQQDQSRIQTQLRSFHEAVEALDMSLEKSKCSKYCKKCKSIAQKAISYKAIITGGDFPSKPYAVQIYTEHKAAYRDLDSDLQELIFSINRH